MPEQPVYFLGYTTKWFILNALYKINKKTSTPLKFLLYLLRVVCCLAILSCIACNGVLIKRSFEGDFEKYGLNYMNACIFTGCFIRQVYYYCLDQETHDLVVKINSAFKYQARGELEKYTMDWYIKRANLITKVWIIYTSFNVTVMLISAAVTSIGSERVLAYDLWYPYDWKVSPFYEMTVLHQTIIQLTMSTTYANTDLFYSCSLLLTAGQFDLLGFEFGNILYNVLLEQGIRKSDVLLFKEKCKSCTRIDDRENNFSVLIGKEELAEIYRVMSTKEFNESLVAGLGELIRFHQDLLSVCKDMKKFFDPLQMSVFVFYVIYLTFMVFILATAKDTTLLLATFQYLIGACLQLFIATYFSQILITQTQKLLYDVYEFPWYLCSKQVKNIFKFVHVKSSTPIGINIGKFGIVSLDTFLMTLKTAFSYYTVLRQVAVEQ